MGTVVVTIGVGEGVGGAVVGDGVSGKAPLSHHVPPPHPVTQRSLDSLHQGPP